CPFHPDKTPSLMVSPAKNICKCFACGEGGTPVHFIMKHENLSYSEALKYLAKKYGIEVTETEMTDEQKQIRSDRESMFILNGYAQKTFSENLFNTDEGRAIGLAYFRERGFRDDIIKKFQLGYSLEEKDAFTKQALKAGYKLEFLEKTGLTVSGENNYRADRFRGRVMFPVHTLSGKVVAFGGRTLKTDKNVAKYVNSPESDIYHKGNELYGIFLARQAIAKQDKCFLVEGYTDVISMHQAGIENVVASSGTALPKEQIRLIMRFTKNVTILRDSDTAGIKAAIRDISLLLKAGMNIKVVLLPEGEDPDSFARKHNASEFADFIAQNETNFVRFKATVLLKESANDPIKQSAMITEIADTIALIPEEIVRLIYTKECSQLLNIDEAALSRRIGRSRQKFLVEEKQDLYPDANDTDRSNRQITEPKEVKVEYEQIEITTPNNALYPFEREILYYVIRYGEKKLPEKTVTEQIIDELNEDGLELENPIFKQIVDETLEKCHQKEFVAATYFRNHINPSISRLAVDLSTDKYIESKIHERLKTAPKDANRLSDRVHYVVMLYKDAVIRKMIEEENVLLKNAEANGDWDETMKILVHLQKLKEAQKTAASQLGERIIKKT
ncbi:MAG: DNA primase, partial [Dysgonamonadaceae bacterium]|nr:DNA primase [Dysgonamonadaceae bacterium]